MWGGGLVQLGPLTLDTLACFIERSDTIFTHSYLDYLVVIINRIWCFIKPSSIVNSNMQVVISREFCYNKIELACDKRALFLPMPNI